VFPSITFFLFNARCIYVTGMPGTGKTATVNGVRSELEEDKTLKGKGKTKFSFIHVNGLKLTDPYQCYSHIYYVSYHFLDHIEKF